MELSLACVKALACVAHAGLDPFVKFIVEGFVKPFSVFEQL